MRKVQSVGSSLRWLAGGDELGIGRFPEVASMLVTWWILAFCAVQHRCSS